MTIRFENCPENFTIMVDGEKVYSNEFITLADVFEKYTGTKEYDGIVAVIQKWYYGYVSETPWCATALCWALAQLGLREYTLQGKTDNVYTLYMMLEKACKQNRCTKIESITNAVRGDIIILCYSQNFNTTASKHVTVFKEIKNGSLYCIGGNQSNSIKSSHYMLDNCIGIYRPHYEEETVRKVEDLPDA